VKECAKLDPVEEKAMVEEGFGGDIKTGRNINKLLK
jgi:hypothetical protein